MRSRLVVQGLGIFGLLVAIHFVEQRGQGATLDRIDQQMETIDRLERRADSLERALERQRGAGPSRGSSFDHSEWSSETASSTSAEELVADEEDPSLEDMEEEGEPEMEEADLINAVDDMFVLEATVASSGDAERRVRQAIGRALPLGASLESVECRSTMCRIEMVQPNNDEYQAFLQDLMMNPEKMPWNAGMFMGALSEPDAPERFMVAVVYLMREGQDMPVLHASR